MPVAPLVTTNCLRLMASFLFRWMQFLEELNLCCMYCVVAFSHGPWKY